MSRLESNLCVCVCVCVCVRVCVCIFLGTSVYVHLYNDVVCVPKPVSLCTHGAVCACVELCFGTVGRGWGRLCVWHPCVRRCLHLCVNRAHVYVYIQKADFVGLGMSVFPARFRVLGYISGVQM